MDLYRLQMNVSSIARLGIPQIFHNNICLIEWADKLFEYNEQFKIFNEKEYPILHLSIEYNDEDNVEMNEETLDEEYEESRLIRFQTEHDSWRTRLITIHQQISSW
jgi:tRNA A37 threonylcarbamoyladenosine biosynthesis protein TsaE